MGFTKPFSVVMAALCGAARLATAAPAAELADLAGRIEYGFYGDEPRVIEAARESLERLAEHDGEARYYLAFGAFRLAQLGVEPDGALVDSCIDGATPAGKEESAEAWVLVAACAAIGGVRRARDPAPGGGRPVRSKESRGAWCEALTGRLHPVG